MSSLGRSFPGRTSAWLTFLAVAAVVAVVVPAAAAVTQGSSKPKVVGHIYTETNNPVKNAVLQFNRLGNGQLSAAGSFATGGKGGLEQEHGCTAMCPFIDAQNEVIVSQNKHFLFAVNPGSSTISSFHITGHGLKLVDQKASGGSWPVSVTNHGDWLYVLNTHSLSIAGFTVSAAGKLTLIKGSKQKLSPGGKTSDVPPKEIQFDNTGHWLAVTMLAVPVIDTFHVTGTGVAGHAKANTTAHPFPFAFSFDPKDRIVDAEIVDPDHNTPVSVASAYNLNAVTGKLTHISTAPTKGFAACWTAITNNGRFVYEVNTGGGAPTGATVSAIKVGAGGHLSLAQVSPPGAPGPLPNGEELARIDDVLTPDNHYLYVLVPGILAPASKIDEFKVSANGHITQIGATATIPVAGPSGLAAN